jgi:hypothetical protein
MNPPEKKDVVRHERYRPIQWAGKMLKNGLLAFRGCEAPEESQGFL